MSDKKEKIFWKCSKCGFNVVAPTPPKSARSAKSRASLRMSPVTCRIAADLPTQIRACSLSG